MAGSEPTIVLSRCGRGRGLYAMRLEERGGATLVATRSFRIDEAHVGTEAHGQGSVRARVETDAAFPGCPYCEAGVFVQCGACMRLTCRRQGESGWRCQWCGQAGIPEGQIHELRTSDGT